MSLHSPANEARRLSGSPCGLSRLMFYTDSTEPSGVGAHMLQLADALRDKVSISFALNDAPASRVLAERARLQGFAVDIIAHDDKFASAFARVLAFRQADLLHVHAGIGWEGWHAPPVARCAGVPAIRTEHLPYLLDSPSEQARYHAGMADLDALICVSEAARQTHLEAGVPAGLLHLVRNGIAPAKPDRCRMAMRESLGLSEEHAALLTVARFTEQKGHRVLLQAVPDVIAAFPQARFLWAGSGPLWEEIGALVGQAGLDKHVRLLGHRADVPDLLAASDVYVLPSLFEGLPLSLLEAYFAQLPVIASRAPGTAEAVIEGETGLLVEPGDPEALAGGIAALLGDAALRARLAGAGARHAVRHFSAGRMADETFAIYEKVLRRYRAETAVLAAQ